MKRMKTFSVVRVYSKSLEQNVFPIPRTIKVTRKCVVLPDEVGHVEPPETVLLHNLIRDRKCPLYEPICDMDSRIAADPSGLNISDEELEDYRRQIAEAEKHVLTNADVILCTCTESASKRIRKATNIQQVNIAAFLFRNLYKMLFFKFLAVIGQLQWLSVDAAYKCSTIPCS